jgi:hypothetical protein
VLIFNVVLGNDQHVQRLDLITAHPQRIHLERQQAGYLGRQLADAGDELGQYVEVSGGATARAQQQRQAA